MQDMLDRVREVEGRLERLLVSGRRNADAEIAELEADARDLEALGLRELAARLRAVAAAEESRHALGASALALAACRLVRARLPAGAPPGAWQPLTTGPKRRARLPDLVLPVARMALAGGEAWACLRRAGGGFSNWVLVEPPSVPAWDGQPDEGQPAPRPGLLGTLAARVKAAAGLPAAGTPQVEGPWLVRTLRGRLRWRARYQLGASGEVQLCALEEAAWADDEEEDGGKDPVAKLREALASGTLKDDQQVGTNWALRLKELEADEPAQFLWADPAAEASFGQLGSDKVWALCWVDHGTIAPLAILRPGGLLQQAAIVHLVPGGAETALAEHR